MNDYPPEFDDPEICEVCGEHVDGKTTSCECPECPVCCSVGDPDCYPKHMPYLPDSVQAFCDHMGIEPIDECLRAIEKHNVYWVAINLGGGETLSPFDTDKRIPRLYERIKSVELGGIAWDGSDWEFSDTESFNGDFGDAIDALAGRFQDELSEHEFLMNEEEEMRTVDISAPNEWAIVDENA